MKLLENLIYSTIIFLAIYTLVSIALRSFEITSIYNAHLIGGVVGTVAGITMFMFFLIKKR